MTYKFKNGDHVRLLPYPGYELGHEGETAVVQGSSYMPRITLDEPCTVHEKGKCTAEWWKEARLELVEPKKQMALKFKIGDHVKLLPYSSGLIYGHEGETAIVMEDNTNPYLKLDDPCTIHKEGRCRVTWWHEDHLKLVEPESDNKPKLVEPKQSPSLATTLNSIAIIITNLTLLAHILITHA